jgi:inosine-uridine nucleoside N-ribohydrolase
MPERMIRRFVCLSVLIGLGMAGLLAGSPPVSVVVDTDMALDDVRALALLMTADGLDLSLVTASDGASSPGAGCANARALLAYFGRTKVPVAAGRTLKMPAPAWRDWSERLRWPEGFRPASPCGAKPRAADLISRTIRRLDPPVIYLCLGPMTNLADALRRDPGLRDRIGRVVYYGSAPDDPTPDWNTTRDPASARAVFASGARIENLWLPHDRLLAFDDSWLERIRKSSTPAARLIASVHGDPAVEAHLREGGLRIWDEMAVLWVVQPESFSFAARPGAPHLRRLESFQVPEVKALYLRLLGVN